jgi:ketosteroid isomerase-like protein
MTVEDDIQDIVREINEAWLERRPADLARFLHDEVVIAPPGFQGRVQGRQAAADSYEQFAAAATVHAADFDEPDVQAWGDTAVATYRFTLDYAMGGAHSRDTGWDVLVLRRAAGTWQVVWRTIIPADSADTLPG